MSDCQLGYTKQFSAAKIEAIEAWAAKWNATRSEQEYFAVTLEDRNFSEGLIVPQEETEDYLDSRKARARHAEKRVEYTVVNASEECWQEHYSIILMD